MNDMQAYIAAEASALALGTSFSGKVCPFCGGGPHKDRSFSITRKLDGTIVYLCHRVKCERTGYISPQGAGMSLIRGGAEDSGGEFKEPTVPLATNHLRFFGDTYGLSPEELTRAGFLFVPSLDRVYQPIFAPDGLLRGEVVRGYKDKVINVYRRFKGDKCPLMSWYGPKEKTTVVVVEDQLSAIKLSRFHRTVALLGTNISTEKAVEIGFNSLKQVLMLDKDAIAAALKRVERWKSLLEMEVQAIGKDPKYWDDEQLKWLNESRVPF